ncbi:thymidylate synthase, flavin-dependent [Candidatus Woesebacteria bacterium RIFOXYA1_FULL_43_9]|uniref:FAD-dependent thymidylate synthase n=1 Tax=Candidatus Woesebacteria bacterium RIFOXYA1_FULL_43_9 TaxID=1802534 RepID=A0A1F8CLY8_9BACT|nr:MAG: thymidylate synthase, flavin-dependent [Candidatus Woesebacteria bacterium RIFOXYA1_FULL_43_9]
MAEILQGIGKFQILTPKDELRRQFLGIEIAGRTCYQSLQGEVTSESAQKFARMILRRGHESVIEHSTMTVLFSECSRGLTHELVRHRLASFSQESTRYVDYAKGGDEPDLKRFMMRCVLPPHQDIQRKVDLDDGRQMSPVEMMNQIELFYRSLRRDGWVAEDARQVLPNALESDIVTTANWREWRHIFRMRTQKAAHWEIRGVMGNLLSEVKTVIPVIFDDFVEAGRDSHGLRYFEQKGNAW